VLAPHAIRCECERSRCPPVVSAESTEHWPDHDRLRDIVNYGLSPRDSLADALVRPCLVEGLPVLPDQAAKMVLVDRVIK
jgi:hypothetical protein